MFNPFDEPIPPDADQSLDTPVNDAFTDMPWRDRLRPYAEVIQAQATLYFISMAMENYEDAWRRLSAPAMIRAHSLIGNIFASSTDQNIKRIGRVMQKRMDELPDGVDPKQSIHDFHKGDYLIGVISILQWCRALDGEGLGFFKARDLLAFTTDPDTGKTDFESFNEVFGKGLSTEDVFGSGSHDRSYANFSDNL